MSTWTRSRAELGEERIEVLEDLDRVTWLDEPAGDPWTEVERLVEDTEDLDPEDAPTEEVPRPATQPPTDEPTIPTPGV